MVIIWIWEALDWILIKVEAVLSVLVDGIINVWRRKKNLVVGDILIVELDNYKKLDVDQLKNSVLNKNLAYHIVAHGHWVCVTWGNESKSGEEEHGASLSGGWADNEGCPRQIQIISSLGASEPERLTSAGAKLSSSDSISSFRFQNPTPTYSNRTTLWAITKAGIGWPTDIYLLDEVWWW